MATPILKTVELTSAQIDKFTTINLQERQTEGVTVRVLEVRTSAPPASPVDGDSYIVGSGSISGAWVGYSLNRIAVYIAGAWYSFIPIEGWHVWNNATDKLIVFNGSNWVNASELSLGVSTFTNGAVPFVASGVLAQDITNLNFDNATDTLTATNISTRKIALLDNNATSLVIEEGTNDYLNISTVNTSEQMDFGNAVTNPRYGFLGTGRMGLGTATPNTRLQVIGAISTGVNALVTSTLTITAITANEHYPCDDVAGSFTITLPLASLSTGLSLTFIKTNISANTITIDADGSETINGAPNTTLTTQYETKTLWSDGTQWFLKL